MLTLMAIVMAGMLHVQRPARPTPSTMCLHESGVETQDQYNRRVAAVTAARLINSAESAYSVDAGAGFYATIEQLIAHKSLEKVPYAPGFEVHLDVLDHAYWFEVVDKTDPCGFRFISNQNGVIFTAEPMR